MLFFHKSVHAAKFFIRLVENPAENKGFLLENTTMKSRIAALEEERQVIAQRAQALESHLQDARRHIDVLQVRS